jgi:hypothetical protein
VSPFLKYNYFSLLIITLIFYHLECHPHQSPRYESGENFPVLAFPEGVGTLIFFFVQDDQVSENIKFDVGLVSEKYQQTLRLILVDVKNKAALTEKHRIQDIPTLILFDNLGTEVYRWLRWDFRSDFSPRDIERKIENLPPPLINNN